MCFEESCVLGGVKSGETSFVFITCVRMCNKEGVYVIESNCIGIVIRQMSM